MAKPNPIPTEQQSVQDRIVLYAQEIGWTYIPQAAAQRLRRFDTSVSSPKEQARRASVFLDELVFQHVRALNPTYPHPQAELVRALSTLRADIAGNQEFLRYLRGEKTYYHPAERREKNLTLIDFEDQTGNTYHVTAEYAYFNGQYLNRADIVFLINGLPVLVIECKNATKDEALAIGIDQLRRYHAETPEMMTPPQLFTVNDAIGFSYGVTWNLNRRNLFNWKHAEIGHLEAKIKSFCAIPRLLKLIRNYILFAEKDEKLEKYILKQHQTAAVEKVVERAQHPDKRRGLVWHTQGSGKTYTILKAAEMLFKAPQSEKPTILLLLDRNELEDQMLRNIEALNLGHVVKAKSIPDIANYLRHDYRGLIVCMLHKFQGMPKQINTRRNIYVLIDEAHRTTGGDLGTYLMQAIPNATLIGFTGTPIDQTAQGKGTFKTFGIDDPDGYLHKYAIAESIADGTTLPLFYALAPNELLVPADTLEEEFFRLAGAEGVTDIEELNKILAKAVKTKTFLKASDRIEKIAQYVADHYTTHIEPLNYKAFLVGVDREACALYKRALDKHLPPEYSQVVYTAGHNDSALLKAYHLTPERELQIRKDFANIDALPKILIVTEKLLTGYDAPCLYCMYLDKPMRDHTLLQAIARVNRPYEDDARHMKKPHGFVLDFIGIFDKLEQALAFDSKVVDVSAIVQKIDALKTLFQAKMEQDVPPYLALVSVPFTDKDADRLIEHFKDPARREEFGACYRQVEMLYEIISPDEFLAPFLDDYRLLSAIYAIVQKAYRTSQKVYADREFMRKTERLIQSQVTLEGLQQDVFEFFEINATTIQQIQARDQGENVKVINLLKSIRASAEQTTDDLLLLSMRQKAEEIQLRYETTQLSTQETLDALAALVAQDVQRRKEQAERGFDNITEFIYRELQTQHFTSPETIAQKMKAAFLACPNWQQSEEELRKLRLEVHYAILEVDDAADMDVAVQFVNTLFEYLFKVFNL